MPPKPIKCVIGKNGVRYYYKNNKRIEKPRDADKKDYDCKQKETDNEKTPVKQKRVISPKKLEQEKKASRDVGESINSLAVKHREFIEKTRKLAEENISLKKENELRIQVLDEKIRKLKQKRAQERDEDADKIMKATLAIDDLKEIQKELKEDKKRIKENLDILIKEKSGLEITLDKLGVEKKLLERETELLKEKIAASSSILNQNAKDMKDREIALDLLRKELSEAKGDSSNKENLLNKLQEKIELSEKEKEDMKGWLQQEKEKVLETEAKLRKGLADATTECLQLQSSLQNELQIAKREMISKDSTIASLQDYQKEIETQISALRKQNFDILAKGTSSEEVEIIKKSIEVLEKKNKSLLDEISRLKLTSEQYERDKNKFVALQKENESLDDLTNKQAKNIEDLRGDVQNRNARIEELEEGLLKLKNEKKRLERLQQTGENEKKIASMETEIKELTKYKEDYQKLYEKVESYTEADNKRWGLGKFFSGVSHVIKNIDLKEELDDKQHSLERAEEKVRELSSSLESAHHKLSEYDTLINVFGNSSTLKKEDESTLEYLQKILDEKNSIIEKLQNELSSNPIVGINADLRRQIEAMEKTLETTKKTVQFQATTIEEKDNQIKELEPYVVTWERRWYNPWTWGGKGRLPNVGNITNFDQALAGYKMEATARVALEADVAKCKAELRREKEEVYKLQTTLSEIQVSQSNVAGGFQKTIEIFHRLILSSYEKFFDINRTDDPEKQFENEKEEKKHEKEKAIFIGNAEKLIKNKDAAGMMGSVERVIKDLVNSVEARNKIIIETKSKLKKEKKDSKQYREYVAVLDNQLKAFNAQTDGVRQYCKKNEKECSAIQISDYNDYVNYVTAVLYFNALNENHPIHPYVALGNLKSNTSWWLPNAKAITMGESETLQAEAEWRNDAKTLIPRLFRANPDRIARLKVNPFEPLEEQVEIEKITKAAGKYAKLEQQILRDFTGITQSELNEVLRGMRNNNTSGALNDQLKKELTRITKTGRNITLPKIVLEYTTTGNVFYRFMGQSAVIEGQKPKEEGQKPKESNKSKGDSKAGDKQKQEDFKPKSKEAPKKTARDKSKKGLASAAAPTIEDDDKGESNDIARKHIKTIADKLRDLGHKENDLLVIKPYIVDDRILDSLGYFLNVNIFDEEDLTEKVKEFLVDLYYNVLIVLLIEHEKDKIFEIQQRNTDEIYGILQNYLLMGWGEIQKQMKESKTKWIKNSAYVLKPQIKRDKETEYEMIPDGKQSLWKMIFRSPSNNK